MKKTIILILISCLTVSLFSACRRPDNAALLSAGDQSEERRVITVQKTAAERAEQEGFKTDNPIGELEQNSGMKLPEDVLSKTLCLNGTYLDGAEAYRIPFKPDFPMGRNETVAEEYVYYFDDETIEKTEKTEYQFGEAMYAPMPEGTLPALEKELGDRMILAIGRAVGPRKGYLTYYKGDYLNGYVQISFQGNTVTDFAVEKTLTGETLPALIQIKEHYSYCRLEKGTFLMNTGDAPFILRNGQPVLLILQRNEAEDTYSIYRDKCAAPLTEDYNAFNEEYLGHLAGFLNNDPAECRNNRSIQYLNPDGTVPLNGPFTHIGRSVKEALKAHKDDLLVALAQKYKLRIWPAGSRQWEEYGFSGGWIAGTVLPEK